MAARKRTIQPGGTRGTVFEQVARVRLGDAAVLLAQQRYAGAIYLAGYAVECLLKWAITRRREHVYLPANFEIHDLGALLAEAGLWPLLLEEEEFRDVFWALADNWGPELRYLAKAPEPRSASKLYEQIVRVYDWVAEQTV
jgi:HEPN domain-containing protein